MHEQRAQELLDRLRGKKVGTWKVQDLINNGKSAAVFSARSTGRTAALKIFDPELIARYGEITQLIRIRRELSLRGLRHPNLVDIYGGGKCPSTNLYFLVMQLVEGNPLSRSLNSIDRDRIRVLLHQIASAAKFLEDNELSHRDIKPDNIVINPDTGDATLLDLGVLRPISSSSTVTDTGDHHFVGTLQYSPPEFLLRKEEDTPVGWRAVTFYQIGAVLYDLLEGHPIFSDSMHPYARLVNAVQNTIPSYRSADLPDLVNLARNCLTKSPDARLRLVTWQDLISGPTQPSSGTAAKTLFAANHAQVSKSPATRQAWQVRWEQSRKYEELAHRIQVCLRRWCVAQESIPPIELAIPSSSGPDRLIYDLCFRQDTTHKLDHHLLIRIVVDVLDIDVQAVDVLVTAGLAESIRFPPTGKPYSLFRGAVEETALQSLFEAVIYPVLLFSTRDMTECGSIDVESLMDQGVEE